MVISANTGTTFDTMRSGIYIVTSAYRKKPAGCTCVWVTRTSFDPPLLAIHMEPDCHTLKIIEQGKRFCINVLGDSALELARSFGTLSGHNTNKFQGVEYSVTRNLSPLLGAAVSYLDCKLVNVIPVGDHRMVLGELVEAAVVSDEPPMIYNPVLFYTQDSLRSRAKSTGHSAE